MNNRKDRQGEEHSLFPLGMPMICWKICPPELNKYVISLSIRNSNLLIRSFSIVELVFRS